MWLIEYRDFDNTLFE